MFWWAFIGIFLFPLKAMHLVNFNLQSVDKLKGKSLLSPTRVGRSKRSKHSWCRAAGGTYLRPPHAGCRSRRPASAAQLGVWDAPAHKDTRVTTGGTAWALCDGLTSQGNAHGRSRAWRTASGRAEGRLHRPELCLGDVRGSSTACPHPASSRRWFKSHMRKSASKVTPSTFPSPTGSESRFCNLKSSLKSLGMTTAQQEHLLEPA